MTTIDIIFIAITCLGALIGIAKGFVKQLATIIGLIAGLIAAKALHASLAEKLYSTITDSMTIAQIISFLTIWIIVPLLFIFIAALFTKAMEAMSLGWINRLFGMFLGGLKYALLICLFINVLEYIDPESQIIKKEKKKMKNFTLGPGELCNLILKNIIFHKIALNYEKNNRTSF